MSLGDFQRAFAALVMSSELRTQMAGATAEALPPALDAYPLSERERRRLVALARDPGLRVFAMLHRATRLSMLSNTLPRTCRALGATQLQEVVHAYWQAHPPTSVVYVREALRFAEFLRSRLHSGALVHDLLPEVLETELGRLELGKAAPTAAAAVLPPVGEALVQTCPRPSPRCSIIAFRRDPRTILPALDRGEVPTDLPAGEYHLALLAVAPGRVMRRPLESIEAQAITASNGERSIAMLCATLGCTPELFRTLLAEQLLIAG